MTNSNSRPTADDGRSTRFLCSLYRGLSSGIMWLGPPATSFYIWRTLARNQSGQRR